jgi:hypothetical protein
MGLNFEWFYHAHGTDCDFDPADPINADDEARIRTKNATLLADLAACDGGVCATRFRPMGIPPDLRSALESWTLPADGTAGPGPRPDNGTGSTG